MFQATLVCFQKAFEGYINSFGRRSGEVLRFFGRCSGGVFGFQYMFGCHFRLSGGVRVKCLAFGRLSGEIVGFREALARVSRR